VTEVEREVLRLLLVARIEQLDDDAAMRASIRGEAPKRTADYERSLLAKL
jgi:hypothetical protein